MCTFVLLLFSELMTDEIRVRDTVNFDEITRVKADHNLLTAVSIMIFAFSIQFMVLPSYSELENRSTARYATASIISTSIYTAAFIIVGICGCLMFGDKVLSGFLINIGSRDGTISIFIRATYCVVLLFHIPYFFCTIKEYALVVYDEIASRSLSTHLETKLADFYKAR